METNPSPDAAREMAEAVLAKYQCPTVGCGGQGWYQDTGSEHAPGCDGSCSRGECPIPVAIQVQCEWCAQYGDVPALARAVLAQAEQIEQLKADNAAMLDVLRKHAVPWSELRKELLDRAALRGGHE